MNGSTASSQRQAGIREWYDRRHRLMGKDAWRPPRAYPVFLDLIGVERGKRLLDVGCDTGHLRNGADRRAVEQFERRRLAERLSGVHLEAASR